MEREVRHYGHPESRLGPVELGIHAAHLHDAARRQPEQGQRGVDQGPGAGVVADSDPAAEYAETRAKANAPWMTAL